MDTAVQPEKVDEFITQEWNKAIPVLMKLLEIPSQSRNYDPEYLTNGLLMQTANAFKDWILAQDLKGLTLELLNDEGYSPFLYGEIQGQSDKTILLYAHMDKQPPFDGWNEGLSAYKPVIKDEKLYARGGADDSYGVFASVLAVKACQQLGYSHPRVVLLFEADEESGSEHIHHYIEKLQKRIGDVSVVFCLDSMSGNYEQLWQTTTLRGLVMGILKVSVLSEGVHSGEASGIVPSSFRVVRQLLDRLENSKTGEVVKDFQVVVPGKAYLESEKTAKTLGESIYQKFPLHNNTQPVDKNPFNAYMNGIWKAQLALVGASGLPEANVAGNVLRPFTTVKISIRLPPTKDPKEAEEDLRRILTTDVPYGATVELQTQSAPGYYAPENEPYLDKILNEASNAYYQKDCLKIGVGGSIPLMNTLQNLYPKSQFVITGVLGPQSNAHGPNEMLHLPYTKNLICCMTETVAKLAKHLK